MRNFLNDIEIVGATMVYQERDVCRWSLDWLYANCDRVCILLDNWDKETEAIVLEYAARSPKTTVIAYSDVPVGKSVNSTQSLIKRRFKGYQSIIRDRMMAELVKMHAVKPIDLLIWPDSDEVFVDEFPRFLEDFWYNKEKRYMMLGFIQVYDDFKTIYSPKMAPHGRVFKYDPTMSATKGDRRCRYYPYNSESAYTIKSVVVHINALTKEYRDRREFFENKLGISFEHGLRHSNARVSILPEDVRKMKVSDISKYNKLITEYGTIPVDEFIKNKNEKLST